jgi:hypothetical protein
MMVLYSGKRLVLSRQLAAKKEEMCILGALARAKGWTKSSLFPVWLTTES